MPDGSAPLLSLAGIPVAIILALALTWPVVATGHLSAASDSNSYLRGGDAIWRIVNEKLFQPNILTDPNPKTDTSITLEDKSSSLGDTSKLYGRSITYAAIFGAVVRTVGPMAMTFLQALLIALAILAMIERSALERPYLLVTGFILLIALSQVAWLSVYLMPDILGAIVLIFAALLVARFDKFSFGQKLFLTMLTAFAVSAHYGNIPLAMATVGLALSWRHFFLRSENGVRQGHLVVAIGIFVVAAAPILNMTASYAVLGEMSMTPLRPPVVLARSIADGPARWYVEEQCSENQHDYCAAFDEEIVDTHYDFLWGMDNRDPNAVQSVRENEWQIVLSATLEYPLEQLAATMKNTAKQFITIQDMGNWMDLSDEGFVKSDTYKLRRIANRIMVGVTTISGVLLLWLLLSRRLTRSQTQILAIITFGLVINAFIFGALSAPAGRYQARVAWLLPLLLILFVAENGFRIDRKLKKMEA